MAETAALTKKQQKALAFRSKQKAKKLGKGDGEQLDVPEQDPVEEEEVVEAPVQKKRKRDDAIENGGKVVEAEVPKGKGKGKAKTAWDEEEEKDEGKKSKKEVKQRFILFVGMLLIHCRMAVQCSGDFSQSSLNQEIWISRLLEKLYKRTLNPQLVSDLPTATLLLYFCGNRS